MLAKLAWDGECRVALFHAIRNFIAKGCPTKLLFYLGSLVQIISSLFCHFRSWHYPDHFGIYSQLNRKRKTWFFIFLNLYIYWIERDKILSHSFHFQNSGSFQYQNWPKRDPMKMNFDNFQMQKWSS